VELAVAHCPFCFPIGHFARSAIGDLESEQVKNILIGYISTFVVTL
jgi:hypothetical protein